MFLVREFDGEKGMVRRTSCPQSNVDFFRKLISTNAAAPLARKGCWPSRHNYLGHLSAHGVAD